MGSSLSKSKAKTKKKNRQSTSSVTTPVKAKKTSFLHPRRHSLAEGLSRPQNPVQWSEGSNSGHHYTSFADGQDQGPAKPTNDLDRSARNSGNSSVPQQSNMSQPRTSTSAGRPSFSLLRGRKSSQFQREDETLDSKGSRRQGQVLHISAPIIEPTLAPSGIHYNRELLYDPHSLEQPPARFQRPRQSLDSNRYQQQQLNPYVEPPRLRSGAYKAPVPSLPVSAQSASPSPPPPQAPSPPPPRPSVDSPAFSSPPHSTNSPIQEPQRLWRESLRNAAAVEGRKNEFGLVRTISNNSSTSLSSSGKGGIARKHKPVSGSTFASSTLSSSSSNASQTSLGLTRQRSRRNNTVHPDPGLTQSRSSPHQQRTFLMQSQQDGLDDNASTLSLPGSRHRRDGGSGEDDSSGNKTSRSGSRNASEMSLSAVAVGSGSPSLAGMSQFSSPYLSTSTSHQPSSPRSTPPLGKAPGNVAYEQQQQQQQQQGWAQPLSVTSLSAIRSRAFHNRTAGSSARESMSSISTANYQWMEDQTEGSGLQDVVNRDSVMMLFNHSPTPQDSGSPMDERTATPTPELLAQQHQEQQTQQHALLKYFFKGNYCAPLNKLDLGSVLDVGCGAGVWMKDMALEFPMTEIHGVDMAIPTRRRRHRVPASKSSSSNKNSPTASEPSSAGTSGVASNGPMSPSASDSMPSNCFFHKADITQGLPFPDNTFDYCHVRLVLWGYPLNSFPELLNELVRVTKKSGWIEFVDMDPCIKKATQPGTHINEWIKTGLIHSNMDPDLVKTLPKFLKEYCDATVSAAAPHHQEGRFNDVAPDEPYGLTFLKSTKISLPFGPWGGKVGELWHQSFTAFLRELEPMMVDAALSGLVMDQYHRQCQLEMQQQQQQAGGGAQATIIDQSDCARMAWSHLIQQLSKDALVTHQSASVPHSTHMSTSPSSLTPNKDMRSYNNFYIVYAQKVDLMELKQVLLLQQLEQEILSPQPNMASSSTFSLVSAATFGSSTPRDQGSKQPNGNLNENPSKNRRLASTLREKLSSPNLHQRYLSSGSLTAESAKAMAGETAADATLETDAPLAVLTRDALETFNRTNGQGQASPVLSPGSSAVPPTPTSIAALSIRSSSRASNRNNSVSGGGHAVGTPGSIASGPESPRNNNAYAAYKRQGSVQSGLGSPQQPPTPLADGLEEGGNRTHVEADYFNQVPVPYSSSHYHHHHPQQQQQQPQQQLHTNTVKRKPSLLSKVLSPSVTGASAGMVVAGSSLVAKLQSQAEEEVDHEQQRRQQQQQQQQEEQVPPSMETESNAPTSFTGVSSDQHPEKPEHSQLATADDTPVGMMAENSEDAGKDDDDDNNDDDDDDDEGSEILIVLQDIDSEEAQSQREEQEEVELATQSQSPEGMVGVVPEYQVAIASQEPTGKSVESLSAQVEHVNQEEEMALGDDEPLDQEHTIDIINRVSMEDVDSARSERTEDSVVDESQLQMLAVDVDADEDVEDNANGNEVEEVLVMMAPDESGPSVLAEAEIDAKDVSDQTGTVAHTRSLEVVEDRQDQETEAHTDGHIEYQGADEYEDESCVPLQYPPMVPPPALVADQADVARLVEDMEECKDEEVIPSSDTMAVEDTMDLSGPGSQTFEGVVPLAAVGASVSGVEDEGRGEKEVGDDKDDHDDREDEDEDEDEEVVQEVQRQDGLETEDAEKAAESRKQKEKARKRRAKQKKRRSRF
ncbi:hypothetical protein BGZ67_006268 [Mortierella alpina]|nr:hypothetical protein BGZ67_006268 [Mortierella alpina]